VKWTPYFTEQEFNPGTICRSYGAGGAGKDKFFKEKLNGGGRKFFISCLKP
jgi:hypothetical protein